MRHLGKLGSISAVVAGLLVFAVFALATGAFDFQQENGTPSVGDLATRVAAVETRVAALEARQGTPIGSVAIGSPAAGTPAATAVVVTVDMVDIAFKPKEFTIPANTPVKVTLKNSGALPHNFSVTDHKNPNVKNLGISMTLQPGQSKTTTINAPAGSYYFYCDQPGHEAAGMFGTMRVVASAVTASASPTATPAPATPSATTVGIPPFQVTITGVTKARTVGNYVKSTARGVFVVVDMTLLNTGNKPADFTSSDVFQGTMLRDGRGRTFSLDDTASIYASKDAGTDFQPGLSYQVTLAFDVPPDATGFTLVVGGHELPLHV